MSRRIWMGRPHIVRAEISDGDLDWLKQKKFLKVMNVPARRALQAARQAMEISVWPGGENCAVVVSLGELDSGFGDWEEADRLGRQSSGKDSLGPAEIGKYLAPLALIPRLPNTIAGHVAREFCATGPCWTSGTEGLLGLDAVIQGARWIADGECDWVIVVRVESDGAMAVILASEPYDETDPEILSWSVGDGNSFEEDKKTLRLSNLENWKDSGIFTGLSWKDEKSNVRIVLGQA